MPNKTCNYGRRGMSSIIALMFLSLFACLAAAYAAFANCNLVTANNQAAVQAARMQAESGMSFMLRTVKALQFPAGTTEETLMANLRQSLAERLEGTGNLQGATISYDGQTVVIPPIAFDGQDRCFEATFSLADDSSVYLRVNGRAGAICRSAGMNLQLMPGASAVFDYGIASRSSIRMMGNASVAGENDPGDSSPAFGCLVRLYGPRRLYGFLFGA